MRDVSIFWAVTHKKDNLEIVLIIIAFKDDKKMYKFAVSSVTHNDDAYSSNQQPKTCHIKTFKTKKIIVPLNRRSLNLLMWYI